MNRIIIDQIKSISPDAIRTFIVDRIFFLSKQSEMSRSSFDLKNGAITCFIPLAKSVSDGRWKTPLFFADIESILSSVSENVCRTSPKSLPELVSIITEVSDNYFGKSYNIKLRNSVYEVLSYESDMYLLLSDFKEKDVAAPFERCLLIHQCLHMLGIDSALVGDKCAINEQESFHHFLIIDENGKKFIYDALNPRENNKCYLLEIGDKKNRHVEDKKFHRTYNLSSLSVEKTSERNVNK